MKFTLIGAAVVVAAAFVAPVKFIQPAPRRPPYLSGAGLGGQLATSIWRPRPFARHGSSGVRMPGLSAVAPSEWC